MRLAIPAATPCQPLYLSACTMAPAVPPGIQYAERAARTKGGSCSHQLHVGRVCGCPQRSQPRVQLEGTDTIFRRHLPEIRCLSPDLKPLS